MVTIPQNIKEDLKKFYTENPKFVFNDQDLLSCSGSGWIVILASCVVNGAGK